MARKISGIYYILNKSTNQIYIGKSIDIKNRLNQHFSSLRHNNHMNAELQRSFNEYGEANFEKGILKACKEQYHDRFEKLYIKKYDSTTLEHGFNLVKGNSKWHKPYISLKLVKPKIVKGILIKKVIGDIGHMKSKDFRL